jgi:hypothetical protein
MLVSHAHAHKLHAYFFSRRSTKMTFRLRLACARFAARLRTLLPVWDLADVK